MIRCIVFLMFWAIPALATQDAWPALYDVTGVGAKDVLNIREAPNARAPIIGSLSPNATSVELIRPNSRETWALVNAGERSGWVNLTFLTRQPGQWAGALPPIARCFGTEPFWGLDTSDDQLVYDNVDGAKQTYRITQSGNAQNRRDKFSLIGTNASGSAIAAISAQACTDGMSDRNFGLSVDLFLQRAQQWEHLAGCCSLNR